MRAGSQVVLSALASSDNLDRGPACARHFGQLVELGVAMGWVVVEEDESANPRQLGEGDGLADRAVTPADPHRALVVRVLPVVDQEIDACGKIEAGRPARLVGKPTRTECRFMVGQIGNARPVGGDPVPDRRSWMDDVLGDNLEAADAYWLLGRVMQDDASVEVADPHWERGGER